MKKNFLAFYSFWHDKKRKGTSKEYMSSQQIEVLKTTEELWSRNSLFKQGYSIKDMSNDLDIPVYYLIYQSQI